MMRGIDNLIRVDSLMEIIKYLYGSEKKLAEFVVKNIFILEIHRCHQSMSRNFIWKRGKLMKPHKTQPYLRLLMNILFMQVPQLDYVNL